MKSHARQHGYTQATFHHHPQTMAIYLGYLLLHLANAGDGGSVGRGLESCSGVSLDYKLVELRSRMAFQRDIKNCNVMVFTETWLDPSAPDYAMFHTDSPFAAGTGQ